MHIEHVYWFIGLVFLYISIGFIYKVTYVYTHLYMKLYMINVYKFVYDKSLVCI
jgi:hypothetical protein